MSSNRVIDALIANGWVETSTPGEYKSKTISDYETTSVTIENISQISFDYRVSSESSYDFFTFYISGRQNIHKSGYVGNSFKYESKTPFYIQFEYSKDGGGSHGDDCVYISNIKYREPTVDLELDNGVIITYIEENRIIGENYEYIIDIDNNLWIKGNGKLLGTYDNFTKIENISNIQELLSLTNNECIYIDTSNNLWIKGEKYNKIYNEFTLIEGYNVDELINFINQSEYKYLLSEDELNIMKDIENGNWKVHFSSEEEKDNFIVNLYNKYEISEEKIAEKENEYKEYLINLYEKYLYINSFHDSNNNKVEEYKIRIKNLETNNSVYLFDSYIKNYKYRQIDNINSDSIDEYSFKYELIENENNNIHKFLYKTLPGDYSLSINDNLNGNIKIYLDDEECNLIRHNGSIIIFIDDKNIEHNIEITYDDDDLNNFYCYINKFIKRSVKINSDKYYLKVYLGRENFNIEENNIKYIDFIFDTMSNNSISYNIDKYLNETIKDLYQFELINKNKENIEYNFSYYNDTIYGIDNIKNEDRIIFKLTKPYSSTPFYNETESIKVVSIKKQCTKMSFYYKVTSSYNNAYNNIYLYIDGIYKSRYNNNTSWTQITIDNLTNEEHEFTWVLYSYNGYYSCIDTIAFNDIVETDSSKFSNIYEKELKDIDDNYINDKYKNGQLSTTPFYNKTEGFKIVSIKKQCTKISFYYKESSSYSTDNVVYLYIDGKYKDRYINTSWTKAIIDNLTDEEHEFTWVLYNSGYYSCIDTIAFNDIVETDSSKFSNTYEKELKNEFYKNDTNSSTPFYNNTESIKVVSIKKQCTKMSFYYKVNDDRSSYNAVYLYIDGVYRNKYYNTSWTQAIIDNLSDEEHEFTWVLYNNNRYYSCIDTIAFNDIVETDSSKFSNNGNIPLADIPTDSNYKNDTNSSTPFYNNTTGFKIVSIKKQCTKMSFYYKVGYGSSLYNSIYLYIDGIYKYKYNNTSWTQDIINDLSDEEHEFTWVLYNSGYYPCIDTIAFNDIVETDSSKFSNTYEKELDCHYTNGQLSATPFYNNTIGIKVISIKKQCTKMSFYYSVNCDRSSYNAVYLYIDGVYRNKYYNTSWTQAIIDNLSDKEHEFTWVLYSYDNNCYSCIDTIAFNDIVETDSSKFSNIYEKELKYIYINNNCINGQLSTTPFYNDTIGIKIVYIKKRCTKMSFYYKVKDSYSSYNIVYLYIDGIYKNKYTNTSWTQITINDLSDKEHEFTWVLYSYETNFYSCIDTIAFNDIVEIESSEFSNNGNIPLADISTDNKYTINNSELNIGFKYLKINLLQVYYELINMILDINYLNRQKKYFENIKKINNVKENLDVLIFNILESYLLKEETSINNKYKNGTKSSTPFYNDTKNIKVVSIKKRCTKMSFYYRVSDSYISNYSSDNIIYLYIDGIYKSRYNTNTSWTQITIDDLTDEEHEFTWVLYNYSSNYYSCIDTIAFNDILETNISNFSNTYEKELKNIYINNTYKNGNNSSTPFYNDISGIKVVSIKKQCTKMSFYYTVKSNNEYYNYIYLYIDGIYKSRYNTITTSWVQITIDDLTDEEHEFTWVLYSYDSNYYSCIDTIAFNDIVETDSSKFSNTYEKELKNINYDYINGQLSTTPFYNETESIKVVSIKKRCTKMSFYYKVKSSYSDDNSIYLYIDGVYKNRYISTSWTQITIDNLANEEHEFTWVLYNCRYYSCIDTIEFNDIVETNINNFSNTYEKELKYERNDECKNGQLSATPFYNDTIAIKIVSIKKQCTKMSFYYKTNGNGHVYLYIDGVYKNGYYTNTLWQQTTISNLTDKEHEFTWVLYNCYNSTYSCIDTIAFNDIVETDSSKFSNNGNIPLANISTDSTYKNGNNSSTPFYNDTSGIKVVSIKKKCTKMSFYYKINRNGYEYNSIYLYIDGVYRNIYYDTSWMQAIIDNLSDKEHEFTWILYSINDNYSCIDTIAFNDIVETDSSKFSNTYEKELKYEGNYEYKNSTNSSTPFYNNKYGFKVVSIKKRCTKMSFYYKVKDDSSNNTVYLYIDGEYKSSYNPNTSWTQITIYNLTDEEHEFTWVLYSYDYYYYSCIDTIAFNDIVETDSSKFSNIYEKELDYYINGKLSTIPFYNDTSGIKVVSIKKRCTKMSFYYKLDFNTLDKYNSIYLYINGMYKSSYINTSITNTSWTQITIDNLTNEEHEFTWILYNYSNGDYSCIDAIAFNDIVEMDSSKFSNIYEKELKNIYDKYKNGQLSATPFYNDTSGIKVVSIKKQCTKMSFYYRASDSYGSGSDNNSVYFYIDGIYRNKYYNTSWTQITIDDLTDEEHEFIWVLYNYSGNYYSCIDAIAFNDIVEMDSSKFINTLNNFNNIYKYKFDYIEPEKDIPFSEQKNKLNEEKYNEFILNDRKNKIFKINPNNYSELESILQSPDIIDIIVSNENGDHIVLTTKAKQRIFTRDIDTNEPNMPFIIKSNPDSIGSLKVSNVKTEFNKNDLEVTNEIDIDDLTNENEDPEFEDIENGYYMKIEDVN